MDGQSVNVDEVVAQALAAGKRRHGRRHGRHRRAATSSRPTSTRPPPRRRSTRLDSSPAARCCCRAACRAPPFPSRRSANGSGSRRPSPGTWELMIDRAAVDQYVASLKAQTDRPAVDATLTFEGVEPVVAPSQVGAELDATAAGDGIVAALISRGGGSDAPEVSARGRTARAGFHDRRKHRRSSAEVELLGSWTTSYVPSASNFQRHQHSPPHRADRRHGHPARRGVRLRRRRRPDHARQRLRRRCRDHRRQHAR